MIFTAIVYKSESKVQKTSVTIIAENFEEALEKILKFYGKNFISLVYEAEKNKLEASS